MENANKEKNFIIRAVLLSVGTLSLALAILGIVLPILPTTPFVLVALACYMRSSDKLYDRLKKSRLYKKTVGRMLEKKGLTLRIKLFILVPVLIMLLGLFLTVDSIIMKVVAILLGIVKTVVFIRIRTIKKQEGTCLIEKEEKTFADQ
jgi:uncharacterized membrane protein YbaN (DUF454 family)